jgi:hypothetical protein
VRKNATAAKLLQIHPDPALLAATAAAALTVLPFKAAFRIPSLDLESIL